MMIGPLMKKAKGVWTIGNMSSLTISIAIELKFGNSALWRGQFGGGRSGNATPPPGLPQGTGSQTPWHRREEVGLLLGSQGRFPQEGLAKGETQTSMDWEGDVTGGSGGCSGSSNTWVDSLGAIWRHARGVCVGVPWAWAKRPRVDLKTRLNGRDEMA